MVFLFLLLLFGVDEWTAVVTAISMRPAIFD